MAMDFTNFQTRMQAVSDAVEGGDFAGARKASALARIALAALPESHDSGQAATIFRKKLDDLDAAINAAEVAALGGGGTTILPVRFGRAS